MSILSVLALFAFSTFIPALAYAAPLATSEKDWQYVNNNSWGWNYSPETQINTGNVDQLEVKWVFPVGSKALAPAGIQSLGLQEGVNTPPIVKDGRVYITTNFLKTYAVDATTGKQLWTHDYTFDVDAVQERLPWTFGGLLTSHLHAIRYWEAGDAILYEGMACDLLTIDGKTGEETMRIEDLCKDVPGNIYDYRTSPTSQANIGTWEQGNQFIIILPGLMHSTIYYGDARHVTMGIDMDTHQIVWRVFSFPPQDRPTKDWALEECDIGFFQGHPCPDVAAANRAGLEWDWAFPGENPSPYGGVTSNWGTLIVDEETGILYTQTGNQGPYTNVSLTPGPRLYGSTIMAIDMNQGERIWWHQPFPHDLYDYDCNWGGILAEIDGLGKTYMKGCKEGRLYVLDAMTGEQHYIIDVIDEQISFGQVAPEAGIEPNEGGVKYHLADPFSYTDMREWGWITDGKYCTAPCKVYPNWFNGIFATDMSYDPTTQTLYHYANAIYTQVTAEHPYVEGGSVTSSQDIYPWNSTIVARDIATGDILWTWFYEYSAQRSHLVVTDDLIFSGFTDGQVKFFDKATGDELSHVNLGSPIAIGPTTGQDSDGTQMVFVVAGQVSIPQAFGAGFGPAGPLQPGTLIALGLSEQAAQQVTITTTQRTTLTSSTTVTSTETTGMPAEVTYAAVGIAVIAIIAAAVLMMRKRA